MKAGIMRRTALGALGAGALLPLAGCGGGGSSAGSDGTSSNTSGNTSGSTTTTDTAAGWPWSGTTTTAVVPTLDDFVTVLASGSLSYRFQVSAISTTIDPLTGVAADTGTVAALVPYRMSKYLVTNAHWRAFCNDTQDRYLPSTSRTAGRYWAGGAYPAGKENHPVFFVSLTAAQAYCAWLETKIDGWHFYVPTEGEWEYAALGGQAGYTYPWGSSAGIRYDAATGTLTTPFNSNALCTQYVLSRSAFATLTYYQDSTVTTLSDGSTTLANDTASLAQVLSLGASGSVTGWQYDSDGNRTWADFANSDQFRELVDVWGGFSSAVGAFEAGKSWCGCHDMAGNAYEWTSTVNLASNGAESGSMVQCIKGGSWYANSSSGKSTGRGEGRAATGAYHSVGFRVAARPKA